MNLMHINDIKVLKKNVSPSDLIGASTDPTDAEALRRARTQEQEVALCIKLRRLDGTTFCDKISFIPQNKITIGGESSRSNVMLEIHQRISEDELQAYRRTRDAPLPQGDDPVVGQSNSSNNAAERIKKTTTKEATLDTHVTTNEVVTTTTTPLRSAKRGTPNSSLRKHNSVGRCTLKELHGDFLNVLDQTHATKTRESKSNQQQNARSDPDKGEEGGNVIHGHTEISSKHLKLPIEGQPLGFNRRRRRASIDVGGMTLGTVGGTPQRQHPTDLSRPFEIKPIQGVHSAVAKKDDWSAKSHQVSGSDAPFNLGQRHRQRRASISIGETARMSFHDIVQIESAR